MKAPLPLCQFCGAETPDRCDIQEDYGCCPWIESGEYERDCEMADDGDDG